MKYNHDLVKDLYPLYIDNELSPSVKQAVEEHLQDCNECRNSYENEDNLFDLLKKDKEPNAPKSLDDRLILKMKLNRIRMITLLLIVVIFSILITDYKNDREKLFIALQEYYSTQKFIPNMVESVKNKESTEQENIQGTVSQFIENTITLKEHFNFIENQNLNETKYFFNLETTRFNKMLEIMEYRFNQGLWSETDETAYHYIQEYFKQLNETTTKDYQKMNHGFSSYFETVNITDMDNFYKNMNLLSYTYTRYHKLPEQLQPIKETELKKRLANTLGTSIEKVNLTEESPLNSEYTYRFETSGEKRFYGLIDEIYGQILEIQSVSDLTDGPIISQKDADKKAMENAKKIYGDNPHLDLIPLGFNYNITANDSRVQLYSYKVVPVIKDYKLYTPFDNGTMLYIDAKNGELNMFVHTRNAPSYEGFEQTNLSIKVPIDTLNKKGLGLKKTVIIYSALSGKFELVYMKPTLNGAEEWKYYSTKTGNEEWIYFNPQ